METKKDVYEVTDEMLNNVANCKLISAGAMTLLGIQTNKSETSVSVVGIECGGVPTEDSFKQLFRALATNTGVRCTVDNGAGNTFLELGMAEQISFASVSARFQIIRKNQDMVIAGMAIDKLL